MLRLMSLCTGDWSWIFSVVIVCSGALMGILAFRVDCTMMAIMLLVQGAVIVESVKWTSALVEVEVEVSLVDKVKSG